MPGLCWLLGHSRGPVSDRIEETVHDERPHVRQVRYCGCCGKRADGFSLVRLHSLMLGPELPRGYGVAWVRWSAPTAVLMPLPFNVLAGALYRLYWWMKVPRGLAESPEEAYRQGLLEGHRLGFSLGQSLASSNGYQPRGVDGPIEPPPRKP